jgi:Uma2 family endonuclease
MSAQPQSLFLTPAAYLSIERQAFERSKFIDGEMYAMAGAREKHVSVVTNLVMLLGWQLRKRPCKVYSTDLRVKVSAKGDYTYPDVIIVCGKPQLEDEHEDSLLNPTVIIEVLSLSTEQYDRGEKFRLYRGISSLQEYLLIAPDHCHVEHYRRVDNYQWMLTEMDEIGATLKLPSVDCILSLAEVYEKVGIE